MSRLDDLERWAKSLILRGKRKSLIPVELQPQAQRHWREWSSDHPDAASDLIVRCSEVAGPLAVSAVLDELMPERVSGGAKPPGAPDPTPPSPGEALPPPPSPTTPSEPGEPAVTWGRVEGRPKNAKVLPLKPHILEVNEHGIVFNLMVPEGWANGKVAGCNAVCYLGLFRDGSILLSKFDHLRRHDGQVRHTRDWNNVRGGYCKVMPAKGEACVLCVASASGHERTRVSAEFVWP